MNARRGARRVKHPRKLGFKLVLQVRFGERGIEKLTPDASTICDVVYVALLAKNGRSLKQGDVVKVGQTGPTKGSLMQRWRGIVGLFPRRKLRRKNEREDRRRLLEATNGKKVWVWARAAGKNEKPLRQGAYTKPLFHQRGGRRIFGRVLSAEVWTTTEQEDSRANRLNYLALIRTLPLPTVGCS